MYMELMAGLSVRFPSKDSLTDQVEASDRKSRSQRQHLGTEYVPRKKTIFCTGFPMSGIRHWAVTARSVAFIC